METLGQILRTRREAKGLLLRQVAAYLDIDQAILSKIGKGSRKPTKDNIGKLSEILDIDREELIIQFLSEKIACEIGGEDCAGRILKEADEKIRYMQQYKK